MTHWTKQNMHILPKADWLRRETKLVSDLSNFVVAFTGSVWLRFRGCGRLHPQHKENPRTVLLLTKWSHINMHHWGPASMPCFLTFSNIMYWEGLCDAGTSRTQVHWRLDQKAMAVAAQSIPKKHTHTTQIESGVGAEGAWAIHIQEESVYHMYGVSTSSTKDIPKVTTK